jgi:hypothetical protein
LQAGVTLNVEMIGIFVDLSCILRSLVKKLISLVTVEMARRLVVPTNSRGKTVSYANEGSIYAASSRTMMSLLKHNELVLNSHTFKQKKV